MEKIYIKNEKLFKNKWQMVIYFILFVILIGAFIYLGTLDYDESLPDNEQFAEDFSLVSEDNVFNYVNATDALMVANGTKGIVLFGTHNEWVNYYANIVNKVAKEVGIDTIYYYDFVSNRQDNNGTYETIVERLSDYVTYNDYGTPEIYAPSLLVVSGDEVLLFDTETAFVRGDIAPSEYWNSFNESAKMQELRNVFTEYLES